MNQGGGLGYRLAFTTVPSIAANGAPGLSNNMIGGDKAGVTPRVRASGTRFSHLEDLDETVGQNMNAEVGVAAIVLHIRKLGAWMMQVEG